MMLVLGIGGLLKLPHTGHQLYVRPIDVVFFFACQQLHKLEVDAGLHVGAMQSAKPC
jgi:hypothetical protein